VLRDARVRQVPAQIQLERQLRRTRYAPKLLETKTWTPRYAG